MIRIRTQFRDTSGRNLFHVEHELPQPAPGRDDGGDVHDGGVPEHRTPPAPLPVMQVHRGVVRPARGRLSPAALLAITVALIYWSLLLSRC